MRGFNKVAVLGGGAFGVALARLAAAQSNDVIIWARDIGVCDGINRNHFHKDKLSHIKLPNNVLATDDIENALRSAELAILALPMPAMKEVLNAGYNFFQPDSIIVSCSKGIDSDNFAFSYDIIESCLPKNVATRACYLSGPSFAAELAADLPCALSIASRDKNAAIKVQLALSTKNCRLYGSDDVIGVCVGGALKNVIAIAAGACTGLKLGHNALAALITRGLREITRLALKLGAKHETMSGLSGMGDLILSCTTNMSRNNQLGLLLAEGFSMPAALQKIGSVVEGANSAKAIASLMNKYQVDMPISRAVYQVLYENVSPHEAISALLQRKLKDENC